MRCPSLRQVLVIADDAKIAAQVSAILGRPKSYLAVVDGPRLKRPDAEAEVIRRNNAGARVKPDAILLAGLTNEAVASFSSHFPVSRTEVISSQEDIADLARSVEQGKSTLLWGNEHIGTGLLTALYARKDIQFAEGPSPARPVPGKSNHLVVCEQGNELSEVIAANYAYALGAGLCVIPEVTSQKSDEFLEHFYSLYENRDRSQTEVLVDLRTQLREMCGPIPVPAGGSITFVTGGLPYGFAFPEVPTTHLFKYPDLGISIINGFAAEQPDSHGTEVAILIDPEVTDAPEIAAATKILPEKQVFVRRYSGPKASVAEIQYALELFPYDLAIIATHCGDAEGSRWTYEFVDSEGIARTLVVDVAIGIARAEEADMFKVTQQSRFVSLDGIDWHDPQKTEKLHVGTAINDYVSRTLGDGPLKPTTTQTIPRVVGSRVLKMYDHNYLPMPKSLAGEGSPIVMNNACGSWHELAGIFTFGNARAYVGTLFMVSTTEAAEIVTHVLDRHFQKPLPHAFWAAQRAVYGEGVRRPYIVTGAYPQRLRGSSRNVPHVIAKKLRRGRDNWMRMLERAVGWEDYRVEATTEIVAYYQRELSAFVRKWFSASNRRR